MGGSQKTETTSTQRVGVAENVAQYKQELADIDNQIAQFQQQAKSFNPMTQASQAQVQNKQLADLQKRRSELAGLVGGAVDVNAAEKQGFGIEGQMLGELQGLTAAGPGQQDVESALASNRSFADMLGQYSQGGFLPSQADFATAQQFTQSAFAPQMEQQRQLFAQQATEAKRLSAQLGRPVNDPIIQAKLAQEQQNQNAMLGAQQTAFGSQFALSLPQQRLQFAGQEAAQRQQLADAAQRNRTLALSLGGAIGERERQFRERIATRQTNQTQVQSSSPGFFDVVGGALGVVGGIASAGSSFGLWGAGGGAAAAQGGGGLVQGSVPNMGFGGSFSSNMGLGVNTGMGAAPSPFSMPQATSRLEASGPSFNSTGSFNNIQNRSYSNMQFGGSRW